jgi:hypothetical protein
MYTLHVIEDMDYAQAFTYLDVCTLCRPFDDQNMMRIRLETDSYHLILQAIQDGEY